MVYKFILGIVVRVAHVCVCESVCVYVCVCVCVCVCCVSIPYIYIDIDIIILRQLNIFFSMSRHGVCVEVALSPETRLFLRQGGDAALNLRFARVGTGGEIKVVVRVPLGSLCVGFSRRAAYAQNIFEYGQNIFEYVHV